MTTGYTFVLASWRHDAEDIRSVREQVLGETYGEPWPFGDDSVEEQSYHVIAYDAASRAVGVARMQPDGRIDYVAVRKPWRGVTVGGALLSYLLCIARARRLESVWSIVPPPVSAFFAKNRFVAVGESATATSLSRGPRLDPIGESADARHLVTERTSEASRASVSSRGPRTRVPGVPPITPPIGDPGANEPAGQRWVRRVPARGETDGALH